MSNRIHQISQSMYEILTSVWVMDQTAVHFLYSSYNIDSIKDFSLFLDMEDDSDLETILDLVISPDCSIMHTIENYLVHEAFNKNHEQTLVHFLTQRSIKARIAFPGDDQTMEIEIPNHVIKRFVVKFNLCFSFPASVTKAMIDYSAPSIFSARILIRQSRWTWTKGLIEFSRIFFSHSQNDEIRMLSNLSWAVTALSGGESIHHIQDQLIDCVKDYQKRIAEIETVNDMMKKNTMETLMSQGVHVPSQSIDSLKEKLDIVQSILWSVFSWAEDPTTSPTSVNLGNYQGEDGMKKIMGLLSH